MRAGCKDNDKPTHQVFVAMTHKHYEIGLTQVAFPTQSTTQDTLDGFPYVALGSCSADNPANSYAVDSGGGGGDSYQSSRKDR